MPGKSSYQEKKHLKALLIMIRIGTFFGYLPIKYNPLKQHSKDGPFECSWVLLAYSYLMWLTCTFVSIQTIHNNCVPEALFLMLYFVFNIQMFFIFWICMAKRSVPQIFNSLAQLIQASSSRLQINFVEWYIPHLPMMILFLMRIVLRFELLNQNPSMTFLDVFQSFSMVFTNGLIYAWIMLCENLFSNINYRIRLRSRGLSADKLNRLMTQYLDIETFLYLISKSCGIPYLAMSTVTVSLDVIYANNTLYSLAPASSESGLQYFLDLLEFVYWNYSLYNMACVCYRSHQLNVQVKKLKWSLDEIQTKRNLNMKILQLVTSFKERIIEEHAYFSAFGSIKFDVNLIILATNKIITYTFAISPLRQP